MRIGVLALQGDFSKHIETLLSLGVSAKEVRKPADLVDCDGLIIPGGESTVITRQIDFIGLRKTLEEFAKQKPVFGTCAGLILMSKNIQASPIQTLGLLDVTVARNAFGRQLDSFNASISVQLEKGHTNLFPAFFIRAPRIMQVGPQVQVLATYKDEPVLVRQGKHLGATFHPELTSDPMIHAYFLSLIKNPI